MPVGSQLDGSINGPEGLGIGDFGAAAEGAEVYGGPVEAAVEVEAAHGPLPSPASSGSALHEVCFGMEYWV
jgi:hypothetical protein